MVFVHEDPQVKSFDGHPALLAVHLFVDPDPKGAFFVRV